MKLVRVLFHNFLSKLIALVVAVVLWSATQGFRAVEASVDLEIESSILRGLVPLDRGDEGDTVRMPSPAAAPAPAPIPAVAPEADDSGTWAAAHAAQQGSD